MSVSDWVVELRTALDAAFGERSPRIGAFATVDDAGRPRVRSVVCRKVEDGGELWVVSDARSEKNRDARARPFGEMAFWMPTLRQQFRIAGLLTVTSSGQCRDLAWNELSEAARALFFWDSPGRPIRADRDPSEAVVDPVAIPSSFELLILKADRVDHLDLNEHPHRRRVWRGDRSWAAQNVNP